MRTVPLFGMVVIIMVGLMGLTIAAPFALMLSYAVAALAFSKMNVFPRLAAQGAVFILAEAILTVVASVVLFSGMSGNAGAGVEVFGREFFDPLFMFPPLALFPVVLVGGEVVMWMRRKAHRKGEPGTSNASVP
jgi:hypothetical protein